jgi:hypothetical protein
MRELDKLKLRELQLLCARALGAIEANNNTLWKFNKQAFHDSQNWYKTVIQWYIDEYGGWPDEVGPGKDVKLISDE